MLFQRVVPAHPEPSLRLHLQQLVNEGLELVVLDVGGPLEVSAQDLVKDDRLSEAVEGRGSAGHLEEDYAEGPEVREGPRESVVQHFRCYIETRPNERVRSFCFLDVLEFILGPCVERSAVVFAIVQSFAVSVVNLEEREEKVRE